MARQLCFEQTNGSFPVQLWQTGFNEFTVVYGKQVKRGLDYGDAASELGACLMHMLACDGKLDNRTKAEGKEAGDTNPYFPAADA